MRRGGLIATMAAVLLTLASPLLAQEEPGPAAGSAAAQEAPKHKPRPRPRTKPATKPAAQPQAKPTEAPAEAASPTAANPIPAAVPTATPFAAPPVACEPGQAVRYQGDRNVELWVTRSGTITIDNPLRPLTPDVTRVLQVVVGGKVATAYGPDLLSLRRGASPATLEGTVGGRIQWDGALVPLPDTLPINAETGEPLAELRFRECGAAPSAKLLSPPKARRTAPSPEAVAAEAEKAEKAAAKAAKPAAKPARSKPAARAPSEAASPDAGLPPPQAPGLHLPQGAIP